MTDKCRWCEQMHGPKCPLVKAVEFHEDGITVKRVEFLTPADYAPLTTQPLFPAPAYPPPSPWNPPWVTYGSGTGHSDPTPTH